jgi:hypothetical protein
VTTRIQGITTRYLAILLLYIVAAAVILYIALNEYLIDAGPYVECMIADHDDTVIRTAKRYNTCIFCVTSVRRRHG